MIRAFIVMVLVVLLAVIALVVFVIADQRGDDCDDDPRCNQTALYVSSTKSNDARRPALAARTSITSSGTKIPSELFASSSGK